jgi:hypothetical protein
MVPAVYVFGEFLGSGSRSVGYGRSDVFGFLQSWLVTPPGDGSYPSWFRSSLVPATYGSSLVRLSVGFNGSGHGIPGERCLASVYIAFSQSEAASERLRTATEP